MVKVVYRYPAPGSTLYVVHIHVMYVHDMMYIHGDLGTFDGDFQVRKHMSPKLGDVSKMTAE